MLLLAQQLGLLLAFTAVGVLATRGVDDQLHAQLGDLERRCVACRHDLHVELGDFRA
ncbi:MAG: hypothetical protein ACRDKY_02095 [Solirubrobacteraceae bacterium]